MDDTQLVDVGLQNAIYRKKLEEYDKARDKSEPIVNTLTTLLRKKRMGLEKEDTAEIDEILLPLFEIERAMPIDPVNYIPPSCYDVLITDIDEKDLSTITNELDVQQYGYAENVGQVDSITGIFYGENLRLFIPMVGRAKG